MAGRIGQGPNTVIENIVDGAFKWWEAGGFSGPKAYVAGAFGLGWLTWAEYEAAVELLDARQRADAA